MKIDKKLIKELVDNLKEFALTELEYQEGQTKIKVSRASKITDQTKGNAVVSQNKTVLKSSDDSDGIRVKSPIIGTAYLAAEPGAKKFVEIGDKIKKGQTVMIVEAMKTMNHVPSTADGEVKKILIESNFFFPFILIIFFPPYLILITSEFFNNIFSVWSRLFLSSITSVMPKEFNPAKITALLSCAETPAL